MAVLLASLGGGCRSADYLAVRKVPRNPLDGPLQLLSRKGPQPTQRTQRLLQLYDVGGDDPAEALDLLQAEMAREPTPEKAQAVAELAYVEAFKADSMGREADALNLYGVAVAHAYLFLFEPGFDLSRNPYDPQFRRSCDLYNGSLEGAMRIVERRGQLLPGKELVIDNAGRRIVVHVDLHSRWRAEDVEKIEFASDFEVSGLRNRHHTYGLGVPLIAQRRPQNNGDPREQFYPPGLSFPMTAFLRVLPQDSHPGEGHVDRHCLLEFYDPLVSTDIQFGDRRVPLETDISTPLAYMLNQSQAGQKLAIATAGLLDPEKARGLQGLYMVQPFDPEKIPVLMVHGLWSSPLTWMEMFNDLLAFPEIRNQYQFWFYMYPTGQPFWTSAAQMRVDLAEARRVLDPEQRLPVLDQMVLVGHSMGGLVSKMQVVESGDAFWSLISDQPLHALQVSPDERQLIQQTLYFSPNPSIRRIVTIGTPHRGSRFANEYTRYLGRKLIRMPSQILETQLERDNPGVLRNADLLTIDTSLDSLAPDSPVLPVLLQAPYAPWVLHHNIVGDLSERHFLERFAERGDGIVSLGSAQLEGVVSQISVDADHVHVHSHPRSILEVRRILHEHLQSMGTASRPSYVVPAASGPPPDPYTPGRRQATFSVIPANG